MSGAIMSKLMDFIGMDGNAEEEIYDDVDNVEEVYTDENEDDRHGQGHKDGGAAPDKAEQDFSFTAHV